MHEKFNLAASLRQKDIFKREKKAANNTTKQACTRLKSIVLQTTHVK